MSHTSVYALFKTTVTQVAELRNGHGSAPPVWDYVSRKVFGVGFYDKFAFNSKYFWPAWKSKILTENERVVLLSTYDFAFVATKDLKKFSRACAEMHDKILSKTEWTWSHWAAIAIESDSLYHKHDFRCVGMVINPTSVADEWAHQDVSKIKKWEVYEQLKAV